MTHYDYIPADDDIRELSLLEREKDLIFRELFSLRKKCITGLRILQSTQLYLTEPGPKNHLGEYSGPQRAQSRPMGHMVHYRLRDDEPKPNFNSADFWMAQHKLLLTQTDEVSLINEQKSNIRLSLHRPGHALAAREIGIRYTGNIYYLRDEDIDYEGDVPLDPTMEICSAAFWKAKSNELHARMSFCSANIHQDLCWYFKSLWKDQNEGRRLLKEFGLTYTKPNTIVYRGRMDPRHDIDCLQFWFLKTEALVQASKYVQQKKMALAKMANSTSTSKSSLPGS